MHPLENYPYQIYNLLEIDPEQVNTRVTAPSSTSSTTRGEPLILLPYNPGQKHRGLAVSQDTGESGEVMSNQRPGR